jgi:hypothetical protein
MSTIGIPHDPAAHRESRLRTLFSSLRHSLSRAAAAPLELSHTERAIRLAESLRAELMRGRAG